MLKLLCAWDVKTSSHMLMVKLCQRNANGKIVPTKRQDVIVSTPNETLYLCYFICFCFYFILSYFYFIFIYFYPICLYFIQFLFDYIIVHVRCVNIPYMNRYKHARGDV